MTRRTPRHEELRIRYTLEEKEEIASAATQHGLMMSEFARLAINQAVKNGITLGKLYAPKGQSLALSN